jgi:hypothetical protein
MMGGGGVCGGGGGGGGGSSGSGTGELAERARGAVYAGPPRRTIGNDDAIFDHENPKIKEDVVRMIVQYLQDEGYVASIMTIQDEANVRFTEHLKNRSHFKGVKTAILGMSILFLPLLFVSYLP